jgi:iron(III) transport system ATP-binding protein
MDAGRIAQAGTPQQLYGADGSVQLGALQLQARHPVAAGAVKVAVRPEAWRLSLAQAAPGSPPGLAGTVQKCAYLGSYQEVTLGTALGSIFVVSSELDPRWQVGQRAWLTLAGRGLSVVAA